MQAFENALGAVFAFARDSLAVSLPPTVPTAAEVLASSPLQRWLLELLGRVLAAAERRPAERLDVAAAAERQRLASCAASLLRALQMGKAAPPRLSPPSTQLAGLELGLPELANQSLHTFERTGRAFERASQSVTAAIEAASNELRRRAWAPSPSF